MELSSYKVESDVEAKHWWFVGRRRLLSRIIIGHKVDRFAPVLDVGSGTGTNLRLLKELGFEDITGLDKSDDAIRFCAEKGFGSIQKGDIYNLPFESHHYQLVLATDVIEHVDDDERALLELKRVLMPKGALLLMAPAFQSLWGLQDNIAHHKRRYRVAPLLQKLKEINLHAEEAFYFNYLFFVPRWLMCRLMRLFRISLESENVINAPFLNRILMPIFTLDVITARIIKPSFGISLCIVVRKDNNLSL